MNIDKFKYLFKTEFYDKSYKRWRIDEEKAGKDIIGDQYEKFRAMYYKSYGFSTGNGRKIFGSSYNCDTVVKRGNDVVILEEDKANYVDSCFLGRAIQNATQVFNSCLKQGIPIPYFVISSSTKYNKYEVIYKDKIETIREDLVDILNNKFIYLPLCEHDRRINGYFETPDNCFTLSDTLIEKQNKFVESLL
jgi:hypothetical protein